MICNYVEAIGPIGEENETISAKSQFRDSELLCRQCITMEAEFQGIRGEFMSHKNPDAVYNTYVCYLTGIFVNLNKNKVRMIKNCVKLIKIDHGVHALTACVSVMLSSDTAVLQILS